MSVGGSFKTQCPTCESAVMIRDPKLVGKTIECPKCKDRFTVEKPKAPSSAAVRPGAPPAAAKKPAKPAPVEDVDDEDLEEDAPPAPKAKPKKPAAKRPEPEDDEEDADETPSKKKSPLGNKKTLGLILGAVGVVVLGVAAFFILTGNQQKTFPPVKMGGGPIKPGGVQPKIIEDDEPKDPKDPAKKKSEENKDPTKVTQPVVLSHAGPEVTNLLPPDTERVFRVHFKNVWEQPSIWRDLALQTPGTFDESELKKRLGFAATNLDEWIRAERMTGPAWSFTVAHSIEPIDMKAATTALGLKPVASPVKKQTYYTVSGAGPLLQQMRRISFGVPPGLRHLLLKAEDRPLYFYLHGKHTMIFADETPMLAFLNAEGRFPQFGEKKADPKTEPKEEEKKPDETPIGGRGNTFLTLKPHLKNMLDDLETKADDKDRVLFSSAQETPQARVSLTQPEFKDFVWYRPGPIWDLTLLTEERKPRIKMQGMSWIQKGSQTYVQKAEFQTVTEADGRELQKDLVTKASPTIVKFCQQFLGLPIKLPSIEGVVDPTKMPESPSKINVACDGTQVKWTMDLDFNNEAYSKALGIALLVLIEARSEVRLAEQQSGRLQLGAAVAQLGKEGLTDRGVPPGQFPPGAFKRPVSGLRSVNYPNQRVGWMASLLPYLGQEPLFRKLNFDQSWRDPSNMLPGRTLVPQFLDPAYPEASFHVSYPDLPTEYAATHFVGIAGVGLDAADTHPDDPAFITKRGILGYEQSAKLEEVQKGRGLSNAILMIQVPHDSLAGVTPWVAGGGATLRGVPEKNSIEPFVLSTDREGRTIQHKGRAGTYAVMADGSVRFIGKGVSDAVFRAMATVGGPAPDPFDLDKDENTPRIAPPK